MGKAGSTSCALVLVLVLAVPASPSTHDGCEVRASLAGSCQRKVGGGSAAANWKDWDDGQASRQGPFVTMGHSRLAALVHAPSSDSEKREGHLRDPGDVCPCDPAGGDGKGILRMRGGGAGDAEGKAKHNKVATLVILRHGQSLWNQENRFTGWMDVPLAQQGIDDAHRSAQHFRHQGLVFDVAYTSVLQRAIKTMLVILEDLGLLWIPTRCEWRLNERHDGVLTGLNKKLAVSQYGEDNIKAWRRGYEATPPPLAESHPCWPGHDVKYDHIEGFSRQQLPLTESLEDTLERVLPCWEEGISKDLREGKTVLVVTHGNTVRALAKHLDGLSNSTIVDVDIPSTTPMIYRFTKSASGDLHSMWTSKSWQPLSAEFLGDEDEVKAAMNKVRAETKTQMWARDIRMLLRRNDWGGNTKDRIEETWRPSGTVTIGRHLLRLPSFPTAHWSKGPRGRVKELGPPGHNRMPVHAIPLGSSSSSRSHAPLVDEGMSAVSDPGSASGTNHAVSAREVGGGLSPLRHSSPLSREIEGHDRLPVKSTGRSGSRVRRGDDDSNGPWSVPDDSATA